MWGFESPWEMMCTWAECEGSASSPDGNGERKHEAGRAELGPLASQPVLRRFPEGAQVWKLNMLPPRPHFCALSTDCLLPSPVLLLTSSPGDSGALGTGTQGS